MSTPGLRRNWPQFSLLVLINAFVGGMVGLERTILPEIAETEFGIAARSAIFSFIVVFGITKALANYAAGRFAQQYGRKKILVLGWMFGLPVPFMLMWAPDWNWIVAANVLLGINQGLAWSANVIMKIDLAGQKDRGLAMGLNEFAGYLAVAAVAFLTGWMATEFGLRPYPFYLGIGLAVAGLVLSVFLVKDTAAFVQHEAAAASGQARGERIFWNVSWGDRNLQSVSQAGMFTNFKDGMAWGVFPLLLMASGLSLSQTGIIVAVYPAFWGLLQIATGKLSDYTGRKVMLWSGLFVQGVSLVGFSQTAALVAALTSSGFLQSDMAALSPDGVVLTSIATVDGGVIASASAGLFWMYLVWAALLGTGTAMVYPTFLAAIGDLTHPVDRAESVGVFRLWRDGGYAVGAIFAGLIADRAGLELTVLLTGVLLLVSGIWLLVRYRS